MPEYFYVCPDCGYAFYEDWPMGEAPPESDCLRCYKRARKRFLPVPVKFVGPGFSCSGRFDRPDERVRAEVEKAKDFDPVLGEPWEQIDKKMRKNKAEGLVRKKEIRLPGSERTETKDPG